MQPRVWILALGERVGEKRVLIEWGGGARKQKYEAEVASSVWHSRNLRKNINDGNAEESERNIFGLSSQ